MVLLILFTVGVSGGIGFYIATKLQQRKAQSFFDQTVGEIQQSNKTLEKNILELGQKLADTEYKLSETEKDYRYLKQQIDKQADSNQAH